MSEMHQYASYVPRLIQHELANAGFESEPRRHIEQSVLLLGDIVGSTQLVEQVAIRGSLAVESLTTNLNSVFSDFVDHIYDAGGDVLFIAGDAFLCYWPGDQYLSLEQATLLAASAALRIQRTMHNRDDGFGNAVQFRIGIGAGALKRVFVGGVNDRWELIISGDVLQQVAQAEKQATAGAVRLSAAAHQLVRQNQATRDVVVELDWRTSNPDTLQALLAEHRVVEHSIADERLEPYLPPSVARRKLSASNTWLHEFRPVTVLMADLSEIPIESDDQIDQFHQSVRSLQTIANRYEGSFRIDIDDKGAMLLSVFGLPALAHENDGIRAIHAAWEMQSSLNALSLHPSIGIATGQALCAALGNDRRRDFLVRGNVINRAARLMHATDGQIACDEPTVKATHATVDYEALPNHLVKGLSSALNVKRPVGVRQAANRGNREIIGRDNYLKTMIEALDRARTSLVSHSVLLQGEAGLGKTSLIDAFALHAANTGTRVLRAAADSIENTSSLFAWRAIFADMFGLSDRIDAVTRRQRVLMQMERYPLLLPLTPLLRSAVGVEFEPTDETRYLEGRTRASKTLDLLEQLLQRFVGDTPSLLIVEDAHWLDSRSTELLLRVCKTLPASCIAISTRPVDEPTISPQDIDNCILLPLQAFDREEIAQLIARRIGVSDVPAELIGLIFERSGGNPFFAEQIVHAMIDDGVLGAENGQFRLEGANKFNIPSNIEGIVLGRLDKLPEQQLILLKMAAIAGQQFHADSILDTMHFSLDRTQAQSNFAGLERAGFLDSSDQEDQYRFRHVITREVTYASMTHAQQVAGHEAFANWLEKRQGSGWVSYPLMAHHWKAAGNQTRALELLEKAGATALYGGGFREALVFYKQAGELGAELNIAPDSRRAAAWEKGLGSAHYFLGELDPSRKHLERCVAILDRPVPVSKSAALPTTVGGALTQWWHRKRNIKSQGHSAPKDKPMFDMLIDAYKTLGQIYYLDGEPAELLVYLNMRGLNIGELAGPSPAFACVLVNMSVTSSMVQLDKAATWYSRRAFAMVENDENRAAAAYVAHIDALRHAQHGDWQTALAANKEAHRLINELGDFTLATEAAAVKSAILLCAGDIATAREAVAQAREVAERSNNQQFLCWALLDGVEIEMAENKLAQANSWLTQAMAIDTVPTDLSSRLDKSRATAILSLREGRNQQARAAASAVLEIIATHPPTSYYFLDFYASAITVLIDQYRADPTDISLASDIQGALKRLKKLSATFWNVRPRYWLLAGRFESARGKDGSAMLEKSLAVSQTMQMPFEQANAIQALSEAGKSTAQDRRHATDIYHALGQRYLAESIQATNPT